MTEHTDWWSKHAPPVSLKISCVEELQPLPVGTKSRTPHHQSPEGDKLRKRQCSTTSLQRMRKGYLNDHPSKDEKGLSQ